MTSSHHLDIWDDRGHVPGYQIRVVETDRIVYERDDPESFELAKHVAGLLRILEARERAKMRKEGSQ